MNTNNEPDVLLEVRDLRVRYASDSVLRNLHEREITAVDGVSFSVRRGTTTGLVGESGSGKSTVGRSLVRLVKPVVGSIIYDRQNVLNLRGRDLMAYRKRVQMIFQDPFRSLNPRLTVSAIVSEPLHIHFPHLDQTEKNGRVIALLEKVGLLAEHAKRYPEAFSGGQRQRIGIARALAVEPEFLVCDEPVSALDVSVQAQIINLLRDLQVELGLTYLFIAHDLAVVEYMSDEVIVMRRGRIIEHAPARQLYESPSHPYTRDLIRAAPQI